MSALYPPDHIGVGVSRLVVFFIFDFVALLFLSVLGIVFCFQDRLTFRLPRPAAAGTLLATSSLASTVVATVL